MTGQFPATRLRRTRASAWSRALHRETVLTPADLIWPLFVTEGSGVEDPIDRSRSPSGRRDFEPTHPVPNRRFEGMPGVEGGCS